MMYVFMFARFLILSALSVAIS